MKNTMIAICMRYYYKNIPQNFEYYNDDGIGSKKDPYEMIENNSPVAYIGSFQWKIRKHHLLSFLYFFPDQ
jgi:hypothetical protein